MARKLGLFAVLLLAGPGCMMCDRYCERQREKCHQYYPPNNCVPAQAPAYYPPNNCYPAPVASAPSGSHYPQPAPNPYCP
jgi:hypothetical protein